MEQIDRADELKITDRYRVVPPLERPVGMIQNLPLFPAVAIPVETKRDFECPADHLDCLRTQLKAVRKILIVGWRGTEAHFLELLKEHLEEEVQIEAVTGGQNESEAVLARLNNAGIRATGVPSSLGFSDYVIARGAEQFFGLNL
jgi:hypothetical protein